MDELLFVLKFLQYFIAVICAYTGLTYWLQHKALDGIFWVLLSLVILSI